MVMRMRYRNLIFVFAFVSSFYRATGGEVKTADDIFNIEESGRADGQFITRKGLINQISQALEGVASITEDILNVILFPVKELIKLDQKAIVENQHKKDIATVRLGSPVCDGEMEFRERRFTIVKDAQERFLEMDLDDEDVLEIAFCTSGGGVRAKAYSLGACVGADKVGLLDTAMCISGLSGSTWFIAPWISSGLPICEYRKRGISEIFAGIDISSSKDIVTMLDAIWVKFAYNQHLNIVDLYGGILANNFLRGLGVKQNMVYLSDQQKTLSDGIFPLPVYTAVLGNRDMPNYWFEFTPFEVGSRWLGAYVPSWAFGRKFKNGKSKSSAPEMSLGFLMGIWGSAFAASFEEAYEKGIKNMKLPKFLKGVPGAKLIFNALKKTLAKLAYFSDLGELRVAWGQVFNYVYKMKESSFKKSKDIKLVDAGVDFNNPVFATYRKPPYGDAPDVIFVFDSGGAVGIEELKLLKEYACQYNLKFPEIDEENYEQRAITIFEDKDDPSIPVVIYLPRVADPYMFGRYAKDEQLGPFVQKLQDFDIEEAIKSGFAGTFNFEYMREEAELIADLAEFNIRAVAYKIKDALKRRLKLKRRIRH